MKRPASESIKYTFSTIFARSVRWFAACRTVTEPELADSLTALREFARQERITVVELNLFDGLGECTEPEAVAATTAMVAAVSWSGPMPLVNRIPQSPGDGLVAWEAIGVGPDPCVPDAVSPDAVSPDDTGSIVADRGAVLIRRDAETISVEYAGIRWIHQTLSGFRLPVGDDSRQGFVHAACREVLESLRDGLESREPAVTFGEVVRTWLCLGDITGPEPTHDPKTGEQTITERYRELNRARTDFFETFAFLRDRVILPGDVMPRSDETTPVGKFYPASTGIGMDGRGFLAATRAVQSDRPDLRVVMLENPRQTSAFDYAHRYSPSSPKFARAVAVVAERDRSATFFISGTASITDSESRHSGDVVRQTHETLDNIAALVGEPNLASMGYPGYGVTLAGLASMRVYVKRVSDIPVVRATCEERLPDVPVVYVVADVCRPELLVEIEAAAMTVAACCGE